MRTSEVPEEAALLLGFSKAPARVTTPSTEGSPRHLSLVTTSKEAAARTVAAADDRFADADDGEDGLSGQAKPKDALPVVDGQFEDAEGDTPLIQQANTPPFGPNGTHSMQHSQYMGPAAGAGMNQFPRQAGLKSGMMPPHFGGPPAAPEMMGFLNSRFAAMHGPPMNAQQLQYHLWLQQHNAIAQQQQNTAASSQQQTNNQTQQASNGKGPNQTPAGKQAEKVENAPPKRIAMFSTAPPQASPKAPPTKVPDTSSEPGAGSEDSAKKTGSVKSRLLKRKLPMAMSTNKAPRTEATTASTDRAFPPAGAAGTSTGTGFPAHMTQQKQGQNNLNRYTAGMGGSLPKATPIPTKPKNGVPAQLPSQNIDISHSDWHRPVQADNRAERPVHVDEISEYDVLLGRGGKTNSHQGNVYYRTIVSQYRPIYRVTPKHGKLLLSKRIVNFIRSKGGRFLKGLRDVAEFWVEVGDKQAVEKTSQALREVPFTSK